MQTEPEHAGTQAEDDSLVEACRRGDDDAFALLLDRYIPSLRTFLALRAPSPHLIDEVAHDAFVFVYRHLDEFKPGTSFRAWVHAIAWNLLRAEVQRFARQRRNLDRLAEWQLEVSLGETAEPEPGPVTEQLRLCLEALPDTARQLAILKYRDDLDTAQIATRLERSLVWVRVTLYRMRAQLRTCLETKLPGSRFPSRSESC